MSKRYFRLAILVVLFPATGLIHGQGSCSLSSRNAELQWESTKEIISDRLGGLPEADRNALSHAINAAESCFDSTSCDAFEVGKCLEVVIALVKESIEAVYLRRKRTLSSRCTVPSVSSHSLLSKR